MATNAFDYWKRRSGTETGPRHVPHHGLDQNPAKREWQIRTAASRLTPISASMNGINLRHSPTSSLASSPLSPPATSQLHSPLAASSTTLASVESLEPDQLIATLHRSPTNGNLFGLLRKKLQSKSLTDKWLDAFCKADGIHFLLEAWKSNREKPLQKLSDAYFQRECMECLKAAFGSPVILDYLIEDMESQQKVLAALDSTNVAVKKQAMDMLSSMCVHNQDGYQKALEIFERFKAEKTDCSRFQLLVDELRQAKTAAYRTTLITLINAVISNNEALRSRVRIRNEFISLKLFDLLFHIRAEANPDEAELFNQLDKFDEDKFADEANLASPDGLDLSNLMDVFHAILAQVSGGPQEVVFLNLLQHLLQVDPHDSLGDVIWSTAEKLVHRATLLEAKEDADLLLRPPVQLVKTADRLKSNQDLSSPSLTAVTFPNTDATMDVEVPGGAPLTGAPPPPPPPPPPGMTSASFVPAPPPPPPQMPTTQNAAQKLNQKSNISNTKNEVFADENSNELMSLPQQNVPKPKTRLKTFNWNKIPVHKVVGKDNLWTKTAVSVNSNMDYGVMEELFAAPQGDSEKTRDSVSSDIERKRKDSNEINLFDPKRSLNVNIFLKQFRSTHENIIDLIRSGDDEGIGAEKLRGLLKILPEPDEIDMLKSYEGNPARLGTAEKFMHQLLQVPNYKLRIEAMLFESEFEVNMGYLKPCAEVIIRTAESIKSSTRLHETLHMVLMAGNFLNTGGYAGNAAGFKLSSLLKLADIRANKPTINLLHYVTEQATITNPSLLSFPDDLDGLSEAAKLSTENLTQEVKSLDVKCQRLTEQLEEADEEVKQRMMEFLRDAQLELNNLNSNVAEIERLRVDIAEFFCEDVATFRLEDCFKIFHNFCQKFRKAIQENEHRKMQEVKAENRRQEEEEKLRRRIAAGESIDNAIKAGQNRATGWSTMPNRRMSDRSGMLSSDEYASDTGTMTGTFSKRDTQESGYASDTAGAKKRARKMIRSSDEDDLMEYLAQGVESTQSRITVGRVLANEALPAFGRHSLRSRPGGRSQEGSASRERPTSGAVEMSSPTHSPSPQQNVSSWLNAAPPSSPTPPTPSRSPTSRMQVDTNQTQARPSSLPLQQPMDQQVPQQAKQSPLTNQSQNSQSNNPWQNIRREKTAQQQVATTPLSNRNSQLFHPNPIGYEAVGQAPTPLATVHNGVGGNVPSPSPRNTLYGTPGNGVVGSEPTVTQTVVGPTPTVPISTRTQSTPSRAPQKTPFSPVQGPSQSIASKWMQPLQENKVQPNLPSSRPWLPSKTLANAMLVFDPKAGCPGEPLGSGTTSPASSSSENVQPHGGRSGEETDTDTIKSGSDKTRKQLTRTASERLRKWRRLPATNGKVIDEEGGMTDASVEEGPRGLSVRNSQSSTLSGNSKVKTLKELRESGKGSMYANTTIRRAVPPWNPSLKMPKSPPKSEASNDESERSSNKAMYLGTNVFDRLSVPKQRSSPPLARMKSGEMGGDESTAKSVHSDSSSSGTGSVQSGGGGSGGKKVTLSLRNSASSSGGRPVGRPSELALSGRTKKNADGSFTTKVSDYTLTSPESPKVMKAALVLSAPVTSRLRH